MIKTIKNQMNINKRILRLYKKVFHQVFKKKYIIKNQKMMNKKNKILIKTLPV